MENRVKKRFILAAAILAAFGLLVFDSADIGYAQSDTEHLLKVINPEQSPPPQEESSATEVEPGANENQSDVQQDSTRLVPPKTTDSADEQPLSVPGSEAVPAEPDTATGETN
jgi:hypothetical protein